MKKTPIIGARFAERCLLTMAVVGAPAIAQVPPASYSDTRTTSFTYYAATDGARNGLLKSETVEPDAANAQLCQTTLYEYTDAGNKKSASTSNCAGATGLAAFQARTSSATWDAQVVSINGVSVVSPSGVFSNTSTNALLQSETRVHDPRFGEVTQLIGPNALSTNWELDAFGRKVKELRADGTKTVTWYCIVGAGLSPTSNSVIDSVPCPTPSSGEMPADAAVFVHSEPRDAGAGLGTKVGPFVRVYKDRLGREIRSATEAFDGSVQPATLRGAVVVKDTAYDVYGAKIRETQPYFLSTLSSTTSGAANFGVTVFAYDVLGRPTDIYAADPQGSEPIGPTVPLRSAHTHIDYAGLTTTTTNDKGQTRKEEKNLIGELVRVTDATGATLVHQRDAFGNLISTTDALRNTINVAYDIRGRKKVMSDPDTGTWTYEYDALGQLVQQQNPNQLAISTVTRTTLQYDVLGRMTKRTEPEYVSEWFYDKYANGSDCNKGAGKLCESSTSNGVSKKLVYDNLGRPINSRITISSGPSFASAVEYEAATGRMVGQTYPTGVRVRYGYTSRGFLETLSLPLGATVNPLPATQGGTAGPSDTIAADGVLWRAEVANAWGKIEQQRFGNGVVGKAAYEAATGRTTDLTAGKTDVTSVLAHHYTWDSLNNLTGRDDAKGDGNTGAVSETFVYGDTLNRLTSYTVAAPGIPALFRTVNLHYNALGMLLHKTDVGNYSYGVQGVGAVRPHALQSVSGAVSTTFVYDANGNLKTASAGKYRSISYTSFNLPDSQFGISGPGGDPRYTWQYDENHARIKEVRVVGASTRTVWYVHPDNQGGLGFEAEFNSGSAAPSNRHFLSAGGQVVGVLVSTAPLPVLAVGQTAPTALATSIAVVKVEYWHKDHLVQCAALFRTYPPVAAKAALARVTLAKMSLALAVQMNGLGSML